MTTTEGEQAAFPIVSTEKMILTDLNNVPAEYLSQFSLENLHSLPSFSFINKSTIENYKDSLITSHYMEDLQQYLVTNEITSSQSVELQNRTEVENELNLVFCVDTPFVYCDWSVWKTFIFRKFYLFQKFKIKLLISISIPTLRFGCHLLWQYE